MGRLGIEYFAEWLANGERGRSSEAIIQRLTGVRIGPYGSKDHPYDPADLGRCEKLLNAHPAARTAFPLVADVSPTWAVLVKHWNELVDLLTLEQLQGGGRAPRTYARMQELRDSVRAVA